MTLEIYFDMDGVLADFDKRISEDSLLNRLRDKWYGLLKKHNREDLRHIAKDDMKKLFAGPQADSVMKELKKAWNDYQSYIFVIANKEGFFLGLEEMPGARELLQKAHRLTGKLPHILTAPIKSNPRCEQEKEEWIRQHFGGLYDRFHCTLDKHTFAAPNAILIDDRPRYIKPFQDNGGQVVHYKNAQQAGHDLEKLVRESSLKEVVSGIVENVLDKMGKKRISKSIRTGAVSPEVYTEFPSDKEEEIVKTVAKNLHRKPYSKHPPMMGISYKKESIGNKMDFSDPNLKIHMSKAPIRKIKGASGQSDYDSKPDGFWYACGDEWIRWVKAEMPRWKGSYLYSVTLDYSRILKITNEQELLAFTDEYGSYRDHSSPYDKARKLKKKSATKLAFEKKYRYINWQQVAEKYAGIEICPYIGTQRLKMIWYYGWDVASGCIWDTSAVKGLKLLKGPKPKPAKK